MCGICGYVGPGDGPQKVKAMLARIVHRGPDDEGLWHTEGMTLGHRRLSIVDLSENGHQPMEAANGACVAVVNGEIYNYSELRRTLETSGTPFRSNSDSEVVLHAYLAYDVASFRKLNGMFAFGLWDSVASKLFLVRDRLGIKPVYYWHEPSTGTFCFASEIKALLAAAGRSRWQIDAEALGQYLTYQNVLGDHTLFAGIRMLPPGHFLEYDRGRVRIEAYWQPELGRSPAPADFSEAVARFRDTLTRSVERHLMSDVPVACYLSSGFDSSIVSAEAARQLSQPPIAFTGHFSDGAWYDESEGAARVARHIGVSVRNVRISAADFEQHLDDVVRALDEPRMGIGAFSQFMVAKAAAAERKVILTGHGGDELFSGYPIFKVALLSKRVVSHDIAIGRDLRSLRASELPHLAFFAIQQMSGRADGGLLPVLFNEAEQVRVLDPRVQSAIGSARSIAPLATILASAPTFYEKILMTYLKIYLPGLLVVEDKISMSHALEARTPLLDNEMLDLSLSISENIKLNRGTLKAIVKEAGRSLLPPQIFNMPKRGFPTPLSAWLRGPLSGWLRSRLCGPESRLSRIFAFDYPKEAVDEYLNSWRRHLRPLDEIATHRVWMLLCLESWLRQTEETYGVTLSVNV
jgi:asparagine synthase (glutamine-hydrolysing)